MNIPKRQNKKEPSMPLKLRIHHDNQRRYAEPVYSGNGKLKPFWRSLDGNEERQPEAVYYLPVKAPYGAFYRLFPLFTDVK